MPIRLHKLILSCAIGLLLSACSEKPRPVPDSGGNPQVLARPELSVSGTALRLKLADGQVLQGQELQGATVHLAVEGGRIASVLLRTIEPDPKDPEILRYDFQLVDGVGGQQPACEANAYGERWGFPLALPVGHPGREGRITLTCVAGAVGKCARFGYKPWAKGPGGEDLLAYHAACVRLVRGDYCGDDVGHTKTGTSIDLADRLHIQRYDTEADPAYAFEAGWSPAGAVCVARTRWQDVLTLEQLRQTCPRLAQAQACDPGHAAAQGALLFNRSQLKPVLAAPAH